MPEIPKVEDSSPNFKAWMLPPLNNSPQIIASIMVLVLMLKLLHDLEVLEYHKSQGFGYLELCRLFRIHRTRGWHRMGAASIQPKKKRFLNYCPYSALCSAWCFRSRGPFVKVSMIRRRAFCGVYSGPRMEATL